MYQYAKTSVPKPVDITTLIGFHYFDLSEELKEGAQNLGERHDFWELFYVDTGCHKMFLEGIERKLGEGQLIAYPPMQYHIGPQSSACVGIASFEAPGSDLNFLKDRIFTLNSKQREMMSGIIRDGLRIFQAKPSEPQLSGRIPIRGTTDYELQKIKNQIELLLLDLCMKKDHLSIKPSATNQENYKEKQMESIVRFLRENTDKNMTVLDIARQVDLSVSSLKRLFSKYYDCGPLTYFMFLKIEKAKEMIKESSMSVTEISERLGFNSIHYFSRAFKSQTGMSPTQYGKTILK